MLNFYTHTNQLTPENRTRVFPMLFDWFYLEHPIVREHFKLVNTIEEASICVLPIDIGYYFSNHKKNEVHSFIALAKENNKQVWIYSAGDFGITLSFNVITFRLGGFHSKMNNQTYILPSFVNDPYDTIYKKEWQPIVKEDKPTIGFVGNADGSFIKWSKEFLSYTKHQIKRLVKKEYADSQSFFPSSSKRYKLLEKLSRNKEINTTFIYRNKYRAGAITKEQKDKTTLAFFENIDQNMYTFCLRGSGNFSVRFYETLIMGRIPLLIDTDVRLPFHDTINWNEHCILATSENFVDKIIAFHKNHTTEELIEIQKKNRKLALEKLNRQQYFISIANQNINKKDAV